MKWREDETINFIEIYRKYDLLWDPKHRHHFNKFKKRDAWEEIAKEIKKPVDECKKKMEYLLAAMRREKMKMRRTARTSTRKGMHEVYRSSWFAFQSLKFLWDKNKPKATQNALPITSDDQENTKLIKNEPIEYPETLAGSMESVADQKYTDPITKKKSGPTTNVIRAKKRLLVLTASSSQKKKVQSSADEHLDKVLKTSTSTANHSTTLDDSFHFGNLVASKLRIYNDDIRCAIQRDILNIFIDANRGYYNKDVSILPNHEYDNLYTSQRFTSQSSPLSSSSSRPTSQLQYQTQLQYHSTQPYLSPNNYGEESEVLKQEPPDFPSALDTSDTPQC